MGDTKKRYWQWIRRNIWNITAFLIAMVAVIFWLILIFAANTESTALTFTGILIATIAAFANVFSNIMTRRALKLAQLTTRPFLVAQRINLNKAKRLIELVIENTGSLPIEKGELTTRIFSTPGDESVSPTEIPLIFPKDRKTVSFPTDLADPQKQAPTAFFKALLDSGAEIRVEIEMTYQAFEKEYIFGCAYKLLPPRKDGNRPIFLQIIDGTNYFK